MRKKKLLHIVVAMGGGVFTYIVELSNQLVEKYDIYIAYATRPQTPENFRDYFDDRIKLLVDEEISIGNFVLTGGELPAMMITDATTR